MIVMDSEVSPSDALATLTRELLDATTPGSASALRVRTTDGPIEARLSVARNGRRTLSLATEDWEMDETLLGGLLEACFGPDGWVELSPRQGDRWRTFRSRSAPDSRS
jgi:hypothetical protein